MFDGYRVEVTLKTTQHIVRGTNLMQATVCVSAAVFSKKKPIKRNSLIRSGRHWSNVAVTSVEWRLALARV